MMDIADVERTARRAGTRHMLQEADMPLFLMH
jgi:hypothetical protein